MSYQSTQPSLHENKGDSLSLVDERLAVYFLSWDHRPAKSRGTENARPETWYSYLDVSLQRLSLDTEASCDQFSQRRQDGRPARFN